MSNEQKYMKKHLKSIVTIVGIIIFVVAFIAVYRQNTQNRKEQLHRQQPTQQQGSPETNKPSQPEKNRPVASVFNENVILNTEKIMNLEEADVLFSFIVDNKLALAGFDKETNTVGLAYTPKEKDKKIEFLFPRKSGTWIVKQMDDNKEYFKNTELKEYDPKTKTLGPSIFSSETQYMTVFEEEGNLYVIKRPRDMGVPDAIAEFWSIPLDIGEEKELIGNFPSSFYSVRDILAKNGDEFVMRTRFGDGGCGGTDLTVYNSSTKKEKEILSTKACSNDEEQLWYLGSKEDGTKHIIQEITLEDPDQGLNSPTETAYKILSNDGTMENLLQTSSRASFIGSPYWVEDEVFFFGKNDDGTYSFDTIYGGRGFVGETCGNEYSSCRITYLGDGMSVLYSTYIKGNAVKLIDGYNNTTYDIHLEDVIKKDAERGIYIREVLSTK